MPAVKTTESQTQLDRAEFPVARAIVREVTQLSERLAALGQNDDSGEHAQINDRLQNALSALRAGTTPEKSPSAADTSANLSPVKDKFETVYAGKFSTLEVRSGVHGKREVRFTLKRGLNNLNSACNEINEAIKGARNYPSEEFKVYRSGNSNNKLSRFRDIVITYTPVIRDSGNRVRGGDDPKTSHQALLKHLGLEGVSHDLHILACGALRIKEGFPNDRKQIGTTNDEGDLNEGMIVRTIRGGYGAGTVRTSPIGVRRACWSDRKADVSLVVAGASPRKKKS